VQDDDYEEDSPSSRSLNTDNNVVLLWDMLKTKFKKSEEDEISRVIGRQLIQKCEDLRDEYKNFHEIYMDMMNEQLESQSKKTKKANLKQGSSSLFSTGGN